MAKSKTEFVVCVFTTVHRASDKEKDHPSPAVLEIPIEASSVEQAQEKIGKAIAKVVKATTIAPHSRRM